MRPVDGSLGIGIAVGAGLLAAALALAGCGSDVETTGGGGGSGGSGASGGTGAAGAAGGSGASGATGNGGSQGAAGGGTLPTGDCDGPEDCDGNPCVEITPGGWRSCSDGPPEEATTCANPDFDECCRTVECVQGLCVVAPLTPECGGPMPLEYNVCATDQCEDDSTCVGQGYDAVCLPAPMLDRKVRACMFVECRVNADCTSEPGGYCAPVDNPCCPAVAGLFCVYPSNGCRTSAECPNGYCDPAAEGAHCEPGGPACPA